MNDLLFAGECPGVGISHVVRDCDFTQLTGFYRNEYQIHYIMDGERFFFSGKKGYRMGKGTIAFVDKQQIPVTNVIGGKFHNRVLIEVEEKWLISMEAALGFEVFRFFGEHHGAFLLNEAEQKKTEELLREIEEVLESGGTNAEARAKVCVMQILLLVAGGAGERAPEFGFPRERMMRYGKVHEITDYIVDHCCEIDSLDDLAKLFFVDKSYLSRIFKEVTNFTVNEFINCQRLGRARTMLAETDMSIDEIARRLGYESLAYFDRVFKKYIDMTPLQYRKSKRRGKQSI